MLALSQKAFILSKQVRIVWWGQAIGVNVRLFT